MQAKLLQDSRADFDGYFGKYLDETETKKGAQKCPYRIQIASFLGNLSGFSRPISNNKGEFAPLKLHFDEKIAPM
jgi:hypothetical protein